MHFIIKFLVKSISSIRSSYAQLQPRRHSLETFSDTKSQTKYMFYEKMRATHTPMYILAPSMNILDMWYLRR